MQPSRPERPSLYDAVGDKHQLFLVALERYQAIELAALRAALVDQHSLNAAIESVLTETVTRIRTKRSARGCLAVNSMIELAPPTRMSRAACSGIGTR